LNEVDLKIKTACLMFNFLNPCNHHPTLLAVPLAMDRCFGAGQVGKGSGGRWKWVG